MNDFNGVHTILVIHTTKNIVLLSTYLLKRVVWYVVNDVVEKGATITLGVENLQATTGIRYIRPHCQ